MIYYKLQRDILTSFFDGISVYNSEGNSEGFKVGTSDGATLGLIDKKMLGVTDSCKLGI